jgi:hypothetical protein
MLSHSAVVIGIRQIVIISVPVAVPVEVSPEQLIANISIGRFLSALKFSAENFCISWLKINPNNALINWRVT